MAEPRTPAEWARIYTDQRPAYIAFVDKLELLLTELLDGDGISYAWVRAGSQSPDEFERSLLRELRAGRAVDDPLESLLQPAWVYVITHTHAAAQEVGELLARQFDINERESVSFEEAAATNEQLHDTMSDPAGYSWPQYLVSLDRGRADLTEWAPYDGLRCLVATMTLLQYVWDTLDGDLPFYWPGSNPTEVQELLGKVATSLASLDSQLLEVKNRFEDLASSYEEAIGAGDFGLPLNGTSLQAYLTVSETVAELVETAADTGMRRNPEFEAYPTFVEQGPLWLLRRLGMSTLAELEAFLRSATQRAPAIFAEIAEISRSRGFEPWAVPDSVVEWLVIVLNRSDDETVMLLDYADDLSIALNTLIGNPIPEAD